ncbi:MAG: hypothetical protein EU550_03280, partial [Promethearchaeota archaeon]
MQLRKENYLITYLGENICQKALNLPDDNFKIVYLKKQPLEIRVIIFEKQMIYHIVIDELKNLVYHECPSINTNHTFHGDFCLHLIKLILSIEPDLGAIVINLIKEYGISVNNLFLKEKHKNFFFFAQELRNSGYILEALNFLLKTGNLIKDSRIEDDLNILLKQNNFLNFFYYLGHLSEDFPNYFSENFVELFLEGFSKCKEHIKKWKIIDLFQIITLIEKILENQELSLNFINKSFISQVDSLKSKTEFNEKYFFYYFFKIFSKENDKTENDLIRWLNDEHNNNFENCLLEIIIEIFQDFYPIEYIKSIQKHLEILEISHKSYSKELKNYFHKINQINKKFLIRKLGFLKLLIKKSRTYKSKIEFNRLNSLFIFAHESKKLNDDFYFEYLLPHLGFLGEKKNLIKPRDIGLNLNLFMQIFDEKWEKNGIIAYYNKRYWSESIKNEISINKGKPLLRYGTEYTHDVGFDFLTLDDTMLIEWDLAENLIYGSQIVAYDVHTLIPNFRNPLFFDLKPFDLCFCEK